MRGAWKSRCGKVAGVQTVGPITACRLLGLEGRGFCWTGAACAGCFKAGSTVVSL